MKKNLLILMSGLMLGGVAMAQKEQKETKKVIEQKPTPAMAIPVATQDIKVVEEKKPASDVLWMSETTHDFGKIAQGKPVTTEFMLKNTGKDSLKLEMVQAGCGCTTPEWKPGPYAPGEDFKIKVGYNAAGEGAFNKPVTITYANGQQKVIYITGTVFSTPATPAPQNNGLGKVQN
ncbi:MAG: DUF1573 domain-containing protein [Bacteroidota bacterium]